MKFAISSLFAIVGCVVPVSSAWAVFERVENICEVGPSGVVNTVKIHKGIPVMWFEYHFKNVASQFTTVFTDPVPLSSPSATSDRTLSLPPGTYTLSYRPPSTGSTHSLQVWPNTIVLQPYTIRPGQGTGCALNVKASGTGAKDRVPKTTLPH